MKILIVDAQGGGVGRQLITAIKQAIPGAEITMVKAAPLGDPIEFRIHGYELTLRLAEAEKIEINS